MRNKNSGIKRLQILYLPIIVSLLSFFIMAVISYNRSYKFMKSQMIEKSNELVELLSRSIENELERNEQYQNFNNELLMNAGEYVISHKDQISNEYLNEIAGIFEIDHIYYHGPNGELMNSADGSFIGWTPKSGDSIYNFMESGENRYVEDVRKGTDTDDYYQFVYLRAEKGEFIQLGNRLETIEHLMPQKIMQSMEENIIDETKILFIHWLLINIW